MPTTMDKPKKPTLLAIVNPRVLLSPLTTQEAVLSLKIEGPQTSLEEVLQYDASQEVAPERLSDMHEVLNYRTAMREAIEYMKDRPVCFDLVLKIHGTLLDGVRGQELIGLVGGAEMICDAAMRRKRFCVSKDQSGATQACLSRFCETQNRMRLVTRHAGSVDGSTMLTVLKFFSGDGLLRHVAMFRDVTGRRTASTSFDGT